MPLLPWVPGKPGASWWSPLSDAARIVPPALQSPAAGACRRGHSAIVAGGEQLVVQGVMTRMSLT